MQTHVIARNVIDLFCMGFNHGFPLCIYTFEHVERNLIKMQLPDTIYPDGCSHSSIINPLKQLAPCSLRPVLGIEGYYL